jgi:DNA-binding response OmpR family regulator
MMYRILLAEDDTTLGYVLKEYLELHRFAVELSRDGEAALEAFTKSSFDICILDVMLPKMDGFSLAVAIRQINDSIPLIFLTARSLKIDKLKGFNIGADDYIVKPVDEEELIARINAVMRRGKVPGVSATETLQIGNYFFDFANQLLIIGEKKQTITVKEAAVLKLLCDHRSKILDRKKALKTLWGESDYFTRRSMDVFISHLRKYLSDDPSVKIKNVHGRGYVLDW